MLVLLLFASPLALVAQPPSGAIGLYPLNNSANDISGNGYNGALTLTTASTNRFGSTGASTQFTAVSSSGTLPLALATAMKDNFTIGYWFKTTMTAPTGTNWYNGSPLVDAESCGSTYNDWGTALIDGGKVSIGIGTPDITIKSTSTYNNGAWHFFTATRNESAGVITLYVDGSQVATTSGTATTARTSSTLIGLGKSPCAATGSFAGSLDDVIAYSRVLTSTEVSTLYTFYNSKALPLKWVSFTGQVKGDKVVLNWETANVRGNDHFEIERSTGGDSFTTIGTQPETGANSYTFTDASPLKGNDLYRIRQVDIDGNYSWSSTVALHIIPNSNGLSLQSNPVTNSLTLINTREQTIKYLRVADLAGRILVNKVCNSSANLISENIQSLKPGYYILHVQSDQNTTTIGFIKL